MCGFTLHVQQIWNPHKHTRQHVAAHCSILQQLHKSTREKERARESERAIHCNALQNTAAHNSNSQHTAQLVATSCNTQHIMLHQLRQTATRCNTLQHAATRYQIRVDLLRVFSISGSISTYTAAHSSTQQHTAPH